MTHYKYLELKARAEKLFKLFADYFDKYPQMIRPDSPLDQVFKNYLIGAMIRRLPKTEAQVYAEDSSWLVREVKDHQIAKNMKRLRKWADENEWDRDLYALIIEFDRWNNYRILPLEIQAPSPYKRRMNKKYKSYMRYLHQIPDAKIRGMVERFRARGPVKNPKYVSFISTQYREGYIVIPVSSKSWEELTKLNIYIFETALDAEEFGIQVSNYFKFITTCTKGLKFWRELIQLLERAYNYKQINNTEFTSRSLDTTFELKRKPLRKYTESLGITIPPRKAKKRAQD